ncbi:hypothetical protein Hdeb2414_s0003g00088991 [Helianthus debilis subsp. tardiflorus]
MQCCVDHEDEISNLHFGTTTWNCIWSFACTIFTLSRFYVIIQLIQMSCIYKVLSHHT